MAGLEPSHGAAVESRVAAFAEALARAGFDFVAPFVAHASGHPEAIASLETFGRASALGLVVGNSKALHPIFFGVLSREPSLRASADPLDAYAERELGVPRPRRSAPCAMRSASRTTARPASCRSTDRRRHRPCLARRAVSSSIRRSDRGSASGP